MTVNRAERQALLARTYYDLAAAQTAIAVVLGQRLGLYSALRGHASTSAELANRTGTDERFIREWLLNQAAAAYVVRDGDRYSLSDVQSDVFVDDPSVTAAFELTVGFAPLIDQLERAFRTGEGIAFTAYDSSIHRAIGGFSRTAYEANLSTWLSRLDGPVASLRAGGAAADLGCGYGWTTEWLARNFPRATFLGVDSDRSAIEEARSRTTERNVKFEVGDASSLSGRFDLVTSFDLLHDVREPERVAAAVRVSLAENGAWLIIEPRLADSAEELMNPQGRFLTALSMMYCVPISRAERGHAYGMTMKRAELIDIIRRAGFNVRLIESDIATVVEAR